MFSLKSSTFTIFIVLGILFLQVGLTKVVPEKYISSSSKCTPRSLFLSANYSSKTDVSFKHVNIVNC